MSRGLNLQAIEEIKQSLSVLENISNSQLKFKFYAYNNLCSAYLNLGNLQSAKLCVDKAITIKNSLKIGSQPFYNFFLNN